MAEGKHLFPFRTEKLSPPAPMVLPGRLGGRVGRRPLYFRSPDRATGRGFLFAANWLRGGWTPTRRVATERQEWTLLTRLGPGAYRTVHPGRDRLLGPGAELLFKGRGDKELGEFDG